MPSSKRKSDQPKQQTRQQPEEDAQKQVPKSILEQLTLRADHEHEDNELGRTNKYEERTNKIHAINLSRSPPSPYPLPSPSPKTRPYNAPSAAWAANASPPFQQLNGRPQTGLSPPQTHGNRYVNRINHANLSVSPPTCFHGRPLSHPNSVPTFGGRSPPNNDMYAGSRRASMFSQYAQTQRPYVGRAPLPHEDQAHFYGAPQLDFGVSGPPPSTDRLTPGAKGYFCGFDTLAGTGDATSAEVENVVICGYEGGLEVYHVQHDGMQLIGVLEGLKGSVVGAKLLAWSDRTDPFASQRPLIVVTIHGPVVPDQSDGDGDESNEEAIAESPQVLPDLSLGEKLATRVTSYQTTVQVYSLADRKLVDTLYTAPAVPLVIPIDSPDFEAPPASSLTVTACSKFVVVAVGGRSGEVYVFSPSSMTNSEAASFNCIGKLWTSVQARQPSNASKPMSTLSGAINDQQEATASPVFALGSRWLALVPPQISAQFSLYGVVTDHGKQSQVPGLTVSMSSAPPVISCAVDTPDDRFVSRLSRIAAKNIAKGAQWASDYGQKLWNQYMGQQPAQAAPDGRLSQQHPEQQQHFPPTHAAADASRLVEDATTVAIYDLERMMTAAEKKSKKALAPVAVFEQALGCSYLSFAPSGLHLLTISKQGDTQVLWDLKRMCHGRGATPGAEGNAILGPHVREVTRITRVTDANVVDVIWSPPSDDKLAVLTDKGTLHVHLMGSASLQWPPPRRSPRPKAQSRSHATSQRPSQHTSPEPPPPSVRSRLTSAYDAMNGATSWLSSIRSRSLSNGAGLPSISSLSLAPAAGAKSAKAVATSAGKAIGQGVHDIRHAADNKIYLRASGHVGPRRAMWMTADSRGLIAVVAEGMVKIFRVRSVPDTTRANGGPSSRRVVLKLMHELPLQGLLDHWVAPAVLEAISPPTHEDDSDDKRDASVRNQMSGMWQPQPPSSTPDPRNERRPSERITWKSFAELQTTAPYAKFHTDPRVSLFVYTSQRPQPLGTSSSRFGSDENQRLVDGHDAAGDAQWVFGAEIPVHKISTGNNNTTVENAGMITGEDEDGFVWRNARDVDVASGDWDGDDIFEGDADVIDFAEDRV